MHFGETLRNSIYEPWKDEYIDYAKLKSLLKEDDDTIQNSSKGKATDSSSWTEQDESTFVEELVNTQLEKVNAFHNDTHDRLRTETGECESTLEQFAQRSKNGEEEEDLKEGEEQTLTEVLEKLDRITQEINQLEKYRRVNYTGFLKAVKKHDRRRGTRYKVRPLLQVRLSAMPFHSEDYSSLLYRYGRFYIDPVRADNDQQTLCYVFLCPSEIEG